MQDGTVARLYAKYFESPIPPRQISLDLPMSDLLKRALAKPTRFRRSGGLSMSLSMIADERATGPGRDAVAVVDLRSDTLTRPTPAMYARIAAAPLGDDGLGHDPTARELEDAGAALLGKEAALYLPSCTMANLVATLCHAGRQEQVVLEAQSHMYTAERGASTFTGTFPVAIPGIDGAMDLQLLADALRPGGSA